MLGGTSNSAVVNEKPQVQKADLSYMGGRYNSVYSIGLLAGLRKGSVFMIARYFRLAGVTLLLSAGFSIVGHGQSGPSDGQKKMLTAEASRQFTFSAKSELAPRWSPDAKQLAFLSNREEEQQQIFLMSMNGGEGR